MLFAWQARVLNRIYQTTYFNSLHGLISEIQNLDYSQVFSVYQHFPQKPAEEMQNLNILLPLCNSLVHKQVSSYDMFATIQEMGHAVKATGNFNIRDVIVASCLSKCKIWPKLYRNNQNTEKLGDIVKFYKNFIEVFKNELDFKFDPNILSAKYTKMMEKNKIKKKTNKAFLEMVASPKIPQVRSAIEANPEILEAIQPQMQKQAVHVAAQSSSLEMIKMLYEMKANFEATDKQKQTPIFYASKRGDINIIRYLVEELRVNIHHEQHQKRNVLYLGAFQGNIQVVEYFYQIGCDINKQSSLGRTPLSKACYLGQVDVVKYLLSVGADMTIRDVKLRSPLHNAAWGREGGRDGKKRGDRLVDDSPECVEILLRNGHQIDVQDCDGFTPFFSSVSSNGIRSFHLLAKSGANLNHRTIKGQNATLIAAKYGHLQILKALIETHKLDYTIRDSYGMATLQAAAISDCEDPTICFDYVKERQFRQHPQCFSMTNFINATLYYKRQNYLLCLIRDKNIQKQLREILKKEAKDTLIDLLLNFQDNHLVEFIHWMDEDLVRSDWQKLVNKLIEGRRWTVINQLNMPTDIKIQMKSAVAQMDQQLLWRMLKMESDCTEDDKGLLDLLTILVHSRKTKTLIRIFRREHDQLTGIGKATIENLCQLINKPQNNVTLIQYCEVLRLKDISKLLQEISEECLKSNKQAMLGFTIPHYTVTTKAREDRYLQLEKTEVQKIEDLLTKEEQQFIEMPHKYINQQKTLVMVEDINVMMEDIEKFNLWGIDIEYYSEDGFICLIQLSTIHKVYIVDCLKNREEIRKLGKLFGNTKKIKIFHGYQNDIRWLYEDFGFKTYNIYDTSKVQMMLDGLKQCPSLKEVALKCLNYDMDKNYQKADWRIRPLLKEMMDYAKMDAEILPYLFAQQLKKVERHKVQEMCHKQKKILLRKNQLILEFS